MQGSGYGELVADLESVCEVGSGRYGALRQIPHTIVPLHPFHVKAVPVDCDAF